MQPPVFHDFSNPVPVIKSRVNIVAQAMWIYLLSQLVVGAVIGFAGGALPGFMIGIGSQFLDNYTYTRLYEMLEALISFARALTTLLATLIAPALAVAFLKQQKFQLPRIRQNFSQINWKLIGAGMCLVYLFSVLWAGLSLFFNWLLHMNLAAETMVTPNQGFLSLFISFLGIVIAAPIMEELFFRGMICQNLKRLNPLFAILFSSLCFAMMHLNFSQGVPTFFMGLIFGYVTLETGNIKSAIFMHMLNNLVAFMQMVLVGSVAASVGITFLTMALGLGGLILLVIAASSIQQYCQTYSFKGMVKLMFSSPWIIGFTAAFLISSIGTLFL